MELDSKQKDVAKGMVLALAVVGCVFAIAYFLQWPLASSDNSRLKLAALVGLAPALVLMFCIGRLAKHRFRTPQDIDGSALTKGTERVKLLQALLQNTLEQTALAIPVYWAASLVYPANFLPLVAAAAVLFIIGRILFFLGYASGASSRATGFGLTFYPSIALLVLVGATAVSQINF